MASPNTVATLLIRLVGDMKGLDSTFKAAKRELRSLEGAFKSTSLKVKASTDAIKNSTKSMSDSIRNSVKSASSDVSKLSSSYKKSVKEISSVSKKLKDRPSIESPVKDKTTSSKTGFKDILDKHGRNASIGFGAVAGGLGAAFYKATKQFAEFDVALQRAGKISGATADQMKQLESSANSLAMSTGIASQEIVEGMATMARMGFETEKILKAMPHILDATIVSGEKFDTVLNVTESTLAAFNMRGEDTQRVVDTLTKATNLSRAKFKSLGEVLKYAAPSAHDLGVSLEELTSAAAIMIQNGKQGGIAGRTLRMSLQRLAKPTEAGAEQLKKLGVVLKDEHGNLRNFSSILNEIHDGLQGYGSAQKIAALSTIFGTEASSGMLSVVNEAPGKFKEWTAALEKSGGATKKLSDEIKKSLYYQLTILGETIKTAARELGKYLAPSVAKVSSAIKKSVKWFLGLSEGSKKAIVKVLELTAAFASLGFAVSVATRILKYAIAPFTLITSLFGKLKTKAGSGGVAGSISGLGLALSALRGPIGIAIGAMSLLFPILSSLRDKYDQAKQKIEGGIKPPPVVTKIATDKPLPKSKKVTIDVQLKVPDTNGEKKKIEEAENKLRDLRLENDRLKNSVTSNWKKMAEEFGKTYISWVDKLNKLISKEKEYTKESKSQSDLRIAQKQLEGRFNSLLFQSIVNGVSKALSALGKLGIAVAKFLRGDFQGASTHWESFVNPQDRTYLPPPVIHRPGFGGPSPISYNNSPTVNITTAHVDSAKVKRYIERDYWSKTGGVHL